MYWFKSLQIPNIIVSSLSSNADASTRFEIYDNVELREKILNMTSDERKELGINKSTLWYIKKNLSEGKTPKIYEKILLKIQ